MRYRLVASTEIAEIDATIESMSIEGWRVHTFLATPGMGFPYHVLFERTLGGNSV